MTQKFYPIGSWFSHHKYGKALLAQTGYNVGNFILICDGNRLTDEFKLQHHPEHSFPGVYQETISEYGLVPDQNTLENPKKNEGVVKSALKKSCFVHLCRYIRPYNGEQIDNMRGATISFLLDYVSKTVTCGVSICNGVNFEKKEGRSRAIDRRVEADRAYSFIFDFPKTGFAENDITSVFIDHIERVGHQELWPKRRMVIRKILKMYEQS